MKERIQLADSREMKNQPIVEYQPVVGQITFEHKFCTAG
jgi:hypothetical protein